MSLSSRREYLIVVKERYIKAQTKTQKSRIIDEVVSVTGYNRHPLLLPTALSDRLIHRTHIPVLNGENYRFQKSLSRQKQKREELREPA